MVPKVGSSRLKSDPVTGASQATYSTTTGPCDEDGQLTVTDGSDEHAQTPRASTVLPGDTVNQLGISATVSGSFRRGMPEVQAAVYELVEAGVKVLSPMDPRIVDNFGQFLFVASDKQRAIRLVQDRHLAAINHSDFLWLVAPAGYIGTSAAMEVGYALQAEIPVYSQTPPNDITMRQYVHVVPNIVTAVDHALQTARSSGSSSRKSSLLLNPAETIDQAHQKLELMDRTLATSSIKHSHDIPEFRTTILELKHLVGLA